MGEAGYVYDFQRTVKIVSIRQYLLVWRTMDFFIVYIGIYTVA